MSEEPATPESAEESLFAVQSYLSPPPWHADVLAAREESIRLGTVRILDWDECKEALRRLFPGGFKD